MKNIIIPVAAVLLLAACADDRAAAPSRHEPAHRADAGNTHQETATDTSPPAITTERADNSGRNVQDRDGTTPTPIDQSETRADLDITQRIRQSIMEDDLLSTMAKNVKVITRGGVVTLRGPVATDSERAAIAQKAINVAGVMQVDNLLEVVR